MAFILIGSYSASWWFFSSETLDWHAIATLATWCMTVLIQRATHRDTQALHAKIDELLKSNTNARSALTELDAKEPEEIAKHRAIERTVK